MTTFFSEINPFLEEEITLYVLPLNDRSKRPENIYNSKPEDGHCFGNIEEALKACNENYRYRVVVTEGSHEVVVNMFDKDLSKVTIQGETKDGAVTNDWLTGLGRTPTTDDLKEHFLTVITKGMNFINCVLPNIVDIFFDHEVGRNRTIYLFNSSQGSSPNLNFYINDGKPDDVSLPRALQIDRGRGLKIENLVAITDRGIALNDFSNVGVYQYFHLEGFSDYNIEDKNFTPALLLRLGYSSFNLNSTINKTMKNGTISVQYGSILALNYSTVFTIDNNSFARKPDNTVNRDFPTLPVLYISDNSAFTSGPDSVLVIEGLNWGVNLENNSRFDTRELVVRGVFYKNLITVNNSNATFYNTIDLEDLRFETFITSENRGSVSLIDCSINSKGLPSDNRRLAFLARNQSLINFNPEATFTSDNEFNQRLVYIPTLNAGFDDGLSRIFENNDT